LGVEVAKRKRRVNATKSFKREWAGKKKVVLTQHAGNQRSTAKHAKVGRMSQGNGKGKQKRPIPIPKKVFQVAASPYYKEMSPRGRGVEKVK